MSQANRYLYLASEYTRYHGGLDNAHLMACRAGAMLVNVGIPFYAPIPHFHHIAWQGGIDRCDKELWKAMDAPFVATACGLVVLRSDGWEKSDGIKHEIAEFTAAHKPIFYIDPGDTIPLGVVADMMTHLARA